MAMPSERAPVSGLGRVVAATIAFVLLAPAALVTVPLAALLLVSRPSAPGELVAAGVTMGYSVWWLLQPGALPDQVLRTVCLAGALVYVTATLATRLSFPHRVIVAAGSALVAVAGGLLVIGSSVGAVQWWVAHQVGLTIRQMVGELWVLSSGRTAQTIATLEGWLEGSLHTMVAFFPAVTLLESMLGLALATALVRRIARAPAAPALEPFREFRFNDHLGWLAVGGLALALVPGFDAVHLPAMNLLVVLAAFYALRGFAVAAFGLAAVGAGGFFLWLLFAVIFFLLLPVVLGGAVLLGVADAGVDLRRRWRTPRTSA